VSSTASGGIAWYCAQDGKVRLDVIRVHANGVHRRRRLHEQRRTPSVARDGRSAASSRDPRG
jgi:hypothetical protein